MALGFAWAVGLCWAQVRVTEKWLSSSPADAIFDGARLAEKD